MLSRRNLLGAGAVLMGASAISGRVQADRTVVRVSVPPLDPGVYTVEWRAMSSDTHKINGNFTFRVGE